LTTEKASIQKAIVLTASMLPVRDMSSCVTPCWMMSPMITKRIRSNAESWLSSFLPRPLVTRKRKKKMTLARMTISI